MHSDWGLSKSIVCRKSLPQAGARWEMPRHEGKIQIIKHLLESTEHSGDKVFIREHLGLKWGEEIPWQITQWVTLAVPLWHAQTEKKSISSSRRSKWHLGHGDLIQPPVPEENQTTKQHFFHETRSEFTLSIDVVTSRIRILPLLQIREDFSNRCVLYRYPVAQGAHIQLPAATFVHAEK